jgi:hypothetical protein
MPISWSRREKIRGRRAGKYQTPTTTMVASSNAKIMPTPIQDPGSLPADADKFLQETASRMAHVQTEIMPRGTG